jgi:hypothetical protein
VCWVADTSPGPAPKKASGLFPEALGRNPGTLCHACVARPALEPKAHQPRRRNWHWVLSQESATAGPPPTHVSTGAPAPADLKKGSDDGDSRAGSTEDSIEVALAFVWAGVV